MAISKTYTPGDIEDKWYQAWLEAKVFSSQPDEREPYTITIPPPNVTGILHMGHILNNTIQDVLIRRKRMQGYNACWVPGTDHASIATEAKVVTMLAKQGIAKDSLTREEFLQYAYEWKDKYGGIILKQLKKLGASCDWDRTAFTMDPDYSRAVIKVFCQLYEEGYIYRGIRMVNWDPQARTAVSDEEVNYKETPGKLYKVQYKIVGEAETYITIATTRPETILGDTAVAIHPEDERYIHLHGKQALVPLVNRPIPIILDTYVDREFGTGALKITPAHDINDYEIGIRHHLDSIDIFEEDGTISPAGELYIGMDRFELRKQIAKDLKEAGHLLEIEDYMHSVGYSERTHVAIEPRLSMQWFLKMKEISQPALDAAEKGDVQLIPNKFINTYRHWMENVRDWCLSRQLWWGHQIPAYYIKGSKNYVVAASSEEALQKAQAKFGADLHMQDLQQDPDVLDTWASSWLWPIAVFDGINRPDNPDISYYYPTNDLVTAPEILFFWVARMIISGIKFRQEIPFKHVYLTGIVRDDLRRKMSKSLGNSPDPLDLIAQYGADGVRVGMLLASPAGNDLLYKESLVEQGRNFANKIWNAFRLVSGWNTMNEPALEREKIAVDWMNNRYEEVAQEIEDHFSKFRISDALMSVYRLIWDDFCSWYLEMVKPDYGKALSQATYEQTIHLFERLMQILHAFMPFITEEIWHSLKQREPGAFIATSHIPSLGKMDRSSLNEMELIKEVISAIRKFRLDQQIPFKEPLDLHLFTASPALFQKYASVISKLVHMGQMEFVDDKPEGMLGMNIKAHEIYIPAGEIDVEVELDKIEKQIIRKEKLMKGAKAKLSNEKFVNNAPEKVVEMEKKKLADAETELNLLRERLSVLKTKV